MSRSWWEGSGNYMEVISGITEKDDRIYINYIHGY